MQNPWPLESKALEFYGDPRGARGSYSPAWAAENLAHVAAPWQLHMGKIPIPHITIHKKCAESLTRILAVTWDKIGRSQELADKLGYSQFSGSFNYRCIRGESVMSMHSFAAAIDWDAPDNPMSLNHEIAHKLTDASPLIVAFKDEGWRWGGDYNGRVDFMHVEAVSG